MTTATYCGSCGTTFYTAHFGASICNPCREIRETRKQNELNRKQIADMNRAASYAAAQNARAIQQAEYARAQAEYARVEAINHQTNVIAEGAILSKDAYNYGYNYADNSSKENNPSNLNVFVSDQGILSWTWNKPYITARLNEQFDKGLCDRLCKVSAKDAYSNMLVSAKKIGKDNAEGTFSTYFTLYTGVKINSRLITSVASVNTNLTRTIDEKTGELNMNWILPFPNNKELNQAYEDGVNEFCQAANTPLLRAERLANEVVEIKRERRKGKSIRFFHLLLQIFCWSTLGSVVAHQLINFYDAFQNSDFIDLVIAGFMSGVWVGLTCFCLSFLYNKWFDHNKKYL